MRFEKFKEAFSDALMKMAPTSEGGSHDYSRRYGYGVGMAFAESTPRKNPFVGVSVIVDEEVDFETSKNLLRAVHESFAYKILRDSGITLDSWDGEKIKELMFDEVHKFTGLTKFISTVQEYEYSQKETGDLTKITEHIEKIRKSRPGRGEIILITTKAKAEVAKEQGLFADNRSFMVFSDGDGISYS